MKEYQMINKQRISAQRAEYRRKNKEKIAEGNRKYHEENKIIANQKNAQHKKKNAKQYQMYSNRRLAQKKSGVIGEKFTVADITSIYGNECFYCKGKFEHIDHYIPLCKGGLHTLKNVRPSCKNCNLRKSSKMPEDFIKLIIEEK